MCHHPYVASISVGIVVVVTAVWLAVLIGACTLAGMMVVEHLLAVLVSLLIVEEIFVG